MVRPKLFQTRKKEKFLQVMQGKWYICGNEEN